MKNGFGVFSAEAAQLLPAKTEIKLWGKRLFPEEWGGGSGIG